MKIPSTIGSRRILFTALYFSEGAPIGFLWWALPTRLRAAGVSVEQIATLVSLLALPWALKFAWAPLVDIFRGRRWGLRSWILSMQLVMGLSLLPLLWIDLVQNFTLLIPLLLVHAVAAATQDASIDALCIASASREERGMLNGWMQAGMLAGRSIFGGATLILMRSLGNEVVVIALVAAIWISAALVFMSEEPAVPVGIRFRERAGEFWKSVRHVARGKHLWLGLIFAGAGGAAYEAVGSVAGPYLIDSGFSVETVGAFFAFPSVACMIAGALIGGRVADRLTRVKTVRVFLLGIVATVLLLSGNEFVRQVPADVVKIILLSLLYFGIGSFSSSSYALFMDLTHAGLGATQFSAFMGATNGCESWSAFAVGRLINGFGYPVAFATMAAVSFLMLLPLHAMEPSGEPETTPS